MRLKFIFTAFLVFSFSLTIFSQDKARTEKIIKVLTSKDMYGRGYVNDGHSKAAKYIAKSFSNCKLKSFQSDENYFQNFTFPINTFPGIVHLEANKKTINLGNSYILAPFSMSGKGQAKVVYLDSNVLTNDAAAQLFLKQNLKNKVIVYNEQQHNLLMDKGLELIKQIYSAKSIIKIQDKKLTASLSTSQYSNPVFEVLKDSFPTEIKKIKFEVEAELKNITSQNVIGYIEGSEQPDSFVVYTAHYDHLGGMGNIYFPGANDNAAGVAMLIDLAYYYSLPENKPKKSILFIAFGAEEAGLIGSEYYTAHPYFPLSKIKFLLNMDLVGTGSKGATVVNATEFIKEFETLQKLNENGKYLPEIKSRGKAANSDHYYFTEEGVPAFFIYLMGGPPAYHDVNDVSEKLPLTKYNELFRLLVDFEKTL